jgi:hypothetical protein
MSRQVAAVGVPDADTTHKFESSALLLATSFTPAPVRPLPVVELDVFVADAVGALFIGATTWNTTVPGLKIVPPGLPQTTPPAAVTL